MCMRVRANDMCNEVKPNNVEYFDYSPFGEVLTKGEKIKTMKESYMRRFIVIIFSIFLIQCSSVNQAPDTLNLFLKEVFLDPNKLLDIKKNFPEYTVDSLLDSQMRERMYINGVISFIASEFHDVSIAKNSILLHSSIVKSTLSCYDFRQIPQISTNDIYFQFIRNSNEASLILCWINVDNRLVLYRIEYGKIMHL